MAMQLEPVSPARAPVFWPAQARPDPLSYGLGKHGPGEAVRAWAAHQARGTAQARPVPTVGTVAAR